VTVTAPPRPPRPSDPVDRDGLEALVNALIEEARRRARRRRRIFAAIVVSAVLVGVAVFAIFDRVAQSQSTSPGVGAGSGLAPGSTRSRIAFMTTSVLLTPGNRTPDLVRSDLYVMNADGSGKRKVTRTAWGFGPPAWSPDGQKIAFDERLDPRKWGGQCAQACNVDIHVVNADGTGRRNLTRNPGYDAGAVWSPDGQKIAYIGTREKGPGRGKGDIYVMNADGSDQRRLTSNPHHDGQPVWSPDSRRIAFTSWHAPNWDIWVMNADGRGLENVTNSRAQDGNPTWSPDGQEIAFVRTRNTTERRDDDFQLYVMNADGSDKRLVMRTRIDPGPAVWSPDGRKLLVETVHRDGNAEIYVMNADGSSQRRLTRNVADNPTRAPAWSPDGRKITFLRASGIWIMNADGSGQRNLTPGIQRVASFSWSPRAGQ
jgi:Tol biopolymer transport system component